MKTPNEQIAQVNITCQLLLNRDKVDPMFTDIIDKIRSSNKSEIDYLENQLAVLHKIAKEKAQAYKIQSLEKG